MSAGGAERYARQVLHWGEDKQRLLARASVLVAGVGGLGATVSQLLARGGVGRLFLVDDGRLDWPDLNRQSLYGDKDVGRDKLAVAAERLRQINGRVEVVELPGRIDADFRPPRGVDAVADCLDNYTARFALYRTLTAGTRFVHGGLAGDFGQVLTLVAGRSRPFEEIFAGVRQPQGSIPVTPDGVAVIAGLMAGELFAALGGAPRLLDRCLVVGLADFSMDTLDV